MQLKRQLGYHLLQIGVIPLEGVDLLASASLVVSRLRRSLPDSMNSSGVEIVGLDSLSTAQLVYCDLSTEAFQNYADLLLLRCTSCGWLL